MSSKISWDEKNLDENEQESLQANRMKIDEPKTPFHRLQEDGEEPESFPPKARAARPAGVGVHDNVPGASAALDLNQITSEALARRGEEPRMGEDELDADFKKNRSEHYKMPSGGLAALRAQAAAAMEEDEDED